MVFQKRGGLTLISRIVLFFLVIGFVWLMMYTINYEEPKIPITILNSSSNQTSNNSLVLAPHDYVWLNISEKTNFSAVVNRCDEALFEFEGGSRRDDEIISYNPLLYNALWEDGGFILMNNTLAQKEEFLLDNNFYVLTIIRDEEQRVSLLEEDFELGGLVYLRFNSLCDDSFVLVSWEGV